METVPDMKVMTLHTSSLCCIQQLLTDLMPFNVTREQMGLHCLSCHIKTKIIDVMLLFICQFSCSQTNNTESENICLLSDSPSHASQSYESIKIILVLINLCLHLLL